MDAVWVDREDFGSSVTRADGRGAGWRRSQDRFKIQTCFRQVRGVLEGIMNAEGSELEVLVGLSSQICNVIPDDFARELENGQMKEIFLKRLVHALNSNMTPTANCPGIRRVIVEHAIYMMECNPGYANCFKKYCMMEALLRVERTPSRAENYRFFLGDAGLMEHSVPLSDLVSRAKELMSSTYQ